MYLHLEPAEIEAFWANMAAPFEWHWCFIYHKWMTREKYTENSAYSNMKRKPFISEQKLEVIKAGFAE